MTYTKTIWLDQIVEKPRTYELITNPDDTITLIDSFGTITELGTPVNAANLNKIEDKLLELDGRTFNTSNLADKDLSNLTATGKATSTNLIMPNYSAIVNKTWDTTYTAPSDGWIFVSALSNTTLGATLTIDSNIVWQNSGYSGGDTNTGLIPIAKNSTYIGTSGLGNQVIKFIPVKGA